MRTLGYCALVKQIRIDIDCDSEWIKSHLITNVAFIFGHSVWKYKDIWIFDLKSRKNQCNMIQRCSLSNGLLEQDSTPTWLKKTYIRRHRIEYDRLHWGFSWKTPTWVKVFIIIFASVVFMAISIASGCFWFLGWKGCSCVQWWHEIGRLTVFFDPVEDEPNLGGHV